MQRLFSTFADGWPGGGILVQRLLTGSMLVHSAIACIRAPHCSVLAPQIIGVAAGISLLVGFWTPLAGGLLGIIELWIALSSPGRSEVPIILAILGTTLAMIGPGAWSIDALLYGRKHIQTPKL